MKLKAIIVDDEVFGRENIQNILNNYCDDIEIVGSTGDTETARTIIQAASPDLLFLDMDLGVTTGIEFLNSFEKPAFYTIFVTAYDNFAVKAFRTNAIDYILKPIDISILKDAIRKVKERLENESRRTNATTAVDPENIKISISTISGIHVIKVSDIIYLQSINYYTNLFLNLDQSILSSKNLKEYENMLKDYGFFRIHNSYIINVRYLEQVVTNQKKFVLLKTKKKIDISRRRQSEFLEFLSDQSIHIESK